MKPLQSLLERELEPRIVLGITVILTAVTAAIDASAPYEVGMSLIYLLPVSFAAWHGGRTMALGTAAACTGFWFANEAWPVFHKFFQGHPLIPYWKVGHRFGYFAVVIYLLRNLRGLLRDHARAERLEREMVAYVSHEFGNQLAIMGLSLDTLAGPSYPEESARREAAWKTLARVLITLKRAVANFLNAERLESGQFALNVGKIDLRAMVLEVAQTMEPLIKQKGLHLETDLPEAAVLARGDQDAISLVFSNLLGNAIKYTPEGGRIIVSVAPDSSGATLSVADTGIGIASDDVDKIFSSYYRASGASTAGKGFGAGLKVSRDLVESHGSRLHVQSEKGRGSRFYFRLPLAE